MMLSLSPHQQTAFRDAVESAAQRADVRESIHNVYLALQDRIDLRQPVCRTSGRCCRFDEFGHRLFVTTMEAAAFLHDVGESPQMHPLTPGPGCPFQEGGLCTVHTIRPFGCRVFFCDETSTQWQREQYEFFHAELKRLHQRLDVPYFYVEWRQFLALIRPRLAREKHRL